MSTGLRYRGLAMREIHVDEIRATVARLCQATCLLPEDVVGALETAREREKSPVAVKVLDQILLNADLARDEMLPLYYAIRGRRLFSWISGRTCTLPAGT